MEVIYILHVVVCVLLVGVILLQDGKTGGLVSVADNTQAVFGAKGANSFLTKLTTWLAIIFMGLSLFLAYEATMGSGESVGDGFQPAAQTSGPDVNGGAAVINSETGEPMNLQDAVQEIEYFKGDDVPEHIRNPESEGNPDAAPAAGDGDQTATEGDQPPADNGDNGDDQNN